MVTEMGTTKKIVVMSGKGGVGKSTVAANLAFGLASRGYDIGILDSDFHGPTIPFMLGVNGRAMGVDEERIIPVEVNPHLKVVSMDFLLPDKDTPLIWRGPMKINMINQFLQKVHWGKLDFLIIDLPPGTGDEPLSIAQGLSDVDGALIVTTPQDVALNAVRRSVNFAKKLNIDILGVIENMSDFKCPHCGEFINLLGKGGGEEMSQDLGVDYLGSVPFDPNIANSGETGIPFYNTDDESSKTFRKILDKLMIKIGDKK